MAQQPPPLWIDAQSVERHLTYPRLFSAIERAFDDEPAAAPRVSLPYQGRGENSSGTLLLMSAILPDSLAVVKIITYNADRASGIIKYIFAALDPVSGELLALIDCEPMSTRRTAAVSVVASQHLANQNPSRILILGTGPVAQQLIAGYAAAYPAAELQLWGRRPAAVRTILDGFAGGTIKVTAADDLDSALREADIVSSATGSLSPIIKGDLLRPGSHLDLIGGFTPAMREADDAVFLRASRVVTDNASAIQEAGDLCQPIGSGLLRADAVELLQNLFSGAKSHRGNTQGITVFKSVGNSVFDLTAARVVIERTPECSRAARAARS